MSRVSGTLRKLVLGGIPFDVSADVNVTVNLSSYTNEGEATSGETMRKMTRKVQTLEGIPIRGDLGDFNILKRFSENISNISISATFANGQTIKATGFIEFENYESDSMTANVTATPRKDWTIFQ